MSQGLFRDPLASVGLPSFVSPVLLCKRSRYLEWPHSSAPLLSGHFGK